MHYVKLAWQSSTEKRQEGQLFVYKNSSPMIHSREVTLIVCRYKTTQGLGGYTLSTLWGPHDLAFNVGIFALA